VKLLAAAALVVLFALPVGAPSETPREIPPLLLGACDPEGEIQDRNGRRFAVFTCDSGAVVFLPVDLLPTQPSEPVIPRSDDEIGI
jgi:hypothetical protein